MADHSDDTILDDELDENDFNFDNENEDDLLAENEYDLIEKSEKQTASETPRDKSILLYKAEQSDDTGEQLEPEEDVLDIGIVEEDIVDSETMYIQQTIVSDERHDRCIESPKVESSACDEHAVSPVEHSVENDEQNEKSVRKENDDIFIEDTISSSVEDAVKNSAVISRGDRDDKSSKSKVISLRKPIRKSYDDVPDLAKVIELVQPSSNNSRSRKSQRATDCHIRKKRDTSDSRYSKYNYDHDDRKKKELSRYDRSRDSDWDRDRDSDWERDRQRERDRNREQGHMSNYREEYSFSSDEGNNSQLMISHVPYYDRNDNYRDPVPVPFDYQQPVMRHMDAPLETHYQNEYQSTVQQYQPDRPIIASVQITQERYQITSDFHVIRPIPPPQMVQQTPPSNSFGLMSNRPPFLRTPHPQSESIQHPYPNSIRAPPAFHMMPPQQVSVSMNIRQPAPPSLQTQVFNPSLSQINQRPPPPPHLPPRGPPMHVQQSLLPGLSQPQLHPPPMNRGTGPQLPMRPPYRPTLPQLQPVPQQMRPSMDLVRPPPQQNMQRPTMMGVMVQNERPPPAVMVRSTQPMLQMSHSQNTFHLENGGRMPPPFRPNVPPPQTIMPRPCEHPPQPVEYFSEQRQFMTSAPPVDSYQQCVNQPPPFVDRPAVQPPPPGVPSGTQPTRNTYLESDGKLNEITYSQYPQDSYYANQPSQQYSGYSHSSDQYTQNSDTINHLKRGSSSIDGSPSKQARYDKDDEEDMKLYCQKVESQKQLREKLVQMKEEQRLKNQMQNFIQNNIKGILEKREQFRRKNEMEIAKQAREVTKRIESMPTDDYRRSSSSVYSSAERRSNRSVSPIRRYDEPVRSKEVTLKDKPKPTIVRNNKVSIQHVEKTSKNNSVEMETDRRQLHKVVKITYKDGTVALKSIPVHSTSGVITKQNVTTPRKIHSSDNLNVTVGGDDVSGVNNSRRRMVISKNIPLPNVKNVLNENIIVESVRKGVTQSSVPLAQRFTNLRASARDEDEEMVSAAKSKNRLVIPDEDGSRTVWIKNITPGTNPALIQKMASTCGTVSKTNWLSGGSQSMNQAKITFCKSEEAKKFCLNFNKKMIDSSLLTVTMVSETR